MASHKDIKSCLAKNTLQCGFLLFSPRSKNESLRDLRSFVGISPYSIPASGEVWERFHISQVFPHFTVLPGVRLRPWNIQKSHCMCFGNPFQDLNQKCALALKKITSTNFWALLVFLAVELSCLGRASQPSSMATAPLWCKIQISVHTTTANRHPDMSSSRCEIPIPTGKGKKTWAEAPETRKCGRYPFQVLHTGSPMCCHCNDVFCALPKMSTDMYICQQSSHLWPLQGETSAWSVGPTAFGPE